MGMKGMMNLTAVPDNVLAQMVRDGAYTKGTVLSEEGGGNTEKYLLVLAVPYGPSDEVNTLPEAMAAFRELVAADDWEERNFMVLTIEDTKPAVSELTYEQAVENEP